MDTKKWWQSKAVIGGIIAALASGLALIRVQFAPEAVDPLATDVIGAIETGVAFVGGIIAIYGRVKANTKIGK
ncbi:MAG: hypothetical protein ABIH03_12345 [Pseudomonadota bacterium]